MSLWLLFSRHFFWNKVYIFVRNNAAYRNPRERQTTLAAASVNPSSHTVPQTSLWSTSRRPSCEPDPPTSLTVHDRFNVWVWNSLPADVQSAPSLTTFHQKLKTHLAYFGNHTQTMFCSCVAILVLEVTLYLSHYKQFIMWCILTNDETRNDNDCCCACFAYVISLCCNLCLEWAPTNLRQPLMIKSHFHLSHMAVCSSSLSPLFIFSYSFSLSFWT